MRRRSQPPHSPTPVPAGPRFWSSIEELSDDPAFQAWVDVEYPAAAEFAPTARRDFLKLMGASFALAGLTGCEKSQFVAALPYVDQPDDVSPGVPRYYATAVTFDGYAQPVIATTWSGRPTKLDGNPDHPVTQGRSDIFMQAAVLQLYDPDRAQGPTHRGEPVTWTDVGHEILRLRGEWTRSQGEGLRLLMGPATSPTLLRQIEALLTQFPKARVHVHEPVGDFVRQNMTAAYGQALDLHYALEKCDVVVSFDDDFLGPGRAQVRNARGWSSARRRHLDRPGVRLYIAESVPSITGAVASARLVADASRMPTLAEALANALGVSDASAGDLTSKERSWIDQVAALCREAKSSALITCSRFDDSAAAVWVARSNDALKNSGLHFVPPVANKINASTLADLVVDMAAGRANALIIVDGNPAYTAPGSLSFKEALKKVGTSLHLGLQRDETGDLCDWQLPLAHALESWSDARAIDGTATIIQPTTTSFYDVRTSHQIMAMLLGQIDAAADAPVLETWKSAFGDDFDARWRQALHDGFVEGTAASPIDAHPATANPPAMIIDGEGLDIVFRPDPTIWDGQFANIGWLQELPKPLTTLTWGNIVAVSPALAKRIGVANGDHVEVTIQDRRVTGPAWIMPGQADNTIALYLGYARKRTGRVGNELGYDAYDVRPADQPWLTKGTLRKSGGAEVLAVTQLHHRMEGFDFVREVTLDHPELPKPAVQPSFYPEKGPARNAWGMVIDLDSCIGCNACVAACTAENNVPVVGKDQVKIGREMHWLRIARYYTGDVEQPRSYFQPVPCMHCEDAPCEMGCPVGATSHSPEGVNQMVYNRCIGTRTCSSYCPYKVRRFNFYDYRNAPESPEQAVHNPDVTLRSRGVMEKCTYCTQRIEAAHVAADKENRPLHDGDVVTACQSACPTRAITFGNINDPNSEVSRLRRNGRHYALLEEQGTRPRTTYLARWNDAAKDHSG
jgi:molybdopterin-containing oxidoreductase family iron-sulfur binding subunit